MSFAGYVARIGERRCAYRVLIGKPEGKGPLGRHNHRWEDNINLMFKKWDGSMNWVDLAQDRDRWPELVNAVMNLWVV